MRKKAVIPACRQHICLPVLFCTIAHIGEDLRRDAGFEDGVDQPVETVGGSASQASTFLGLAIRKPLEFLLKCADNSLQISLN